MSKSMGAGGRRHAATRRRFETQEGSGMGYHAGGKEPKPRLPAEALYQSASYDEALRGKFVAYKLITIQNKQVELSPMMQEAMTSSQPAVAAPAL